jgi:predicted DCC family thiol-disulfide oxidoreductase YuxK
LVRFVIHRDGEARFYYASLQSGFARGFLADRGRSNAELDTIIVIAHYRSDMERLLSKAAAALFILRELGGIWWWTGIVGLLPNRLLEIVYDFVAKKRYRFFGKYDSCSLPDREHHSRFIEV